MHPTIIEINSQQFIQNLITIRQYTSVASVAQPLTNQRHRTSSPLICLPIKANAYGHGLVGIAKLAEHYVDYFAVACLDEAIALNKANIKKTPILVLGAFSQEQISDLVAYGFEVTISSLYKAKLISEHCKQHQQKCRVHVKIDTGMNRIGVRVQSATELIDFVLQNNQYLELVGVYSHLSSSDDINDNATNIQIAQFSQCAHYAKTKKPNVLCHLANSGGVLNFPQSYFDMVRPGIMAYGYSPQLSQDLSSIHSILESIKPCFSLKSQIAYFKVVASSQGVSYNHRYITKSQTRVVTIPVGYGDGYRRVLSNVGEVIIGGHRFKISGTICMDMLMVDIGMNYEAYVGDEVVLIGKQQHEEITLTEVASLCGTITYEILCGFNARIPIMYTPLT